MDIRAIGNSRITAPHRSDALPNGSSDAPSNAPSSGASDGPPALSAFERVAWFDLNGDGKIDNVPTLYGGDAYLAPSNDSVDGKLADRIAIAAPDHHAAPKHAGATTHQLARATAAYAAHAAPSHD